MADTTTTNYGLTKPEVGASEDTWGTKINTNLDTLDTTVDSIQGKSGAGVLKHTNNTKLATTSTGIDVTGNMISDGVGIGTSSPSYPFHLSSSGDTVAAVTAGAASVAALNLGNSTNLADGGIRYDNSANALILRASNTERMRIDASGRVGIGTTNPDTSLHVTTPSGTKTELNLAQTAVTNYRLSIPASTDALTFVYGASTERMRIDASGNVLVGKTAAGFANTGHELRGGGSYAAFTRDGGTPVLVNRKSSDGTLVEYMKDGTTVGSIGVEGSDLTIGTGDTGLQFRDASDAIRPFNISTNAARDANIDLGRSSERFRDLYLSGTGYFGTSVGIGTTSPAYKTQISDSGDTVLSVTSGDSSSASLYLGDAVATRGRLTYNNANDSLAVYTDNNERIRIDSSGNVGIGTSSPAAKLHVSNGSSGFEFSPDGISDGTSYMQVYDRVANSYDNLRYYAREHYFHCDNFEKMRLDSAGRLGLGVTPEAWSSVFKVLRVGTGSSIAGESGGTSTWFNTNAYYDGSWKRINTNTSAQIAHTSDGKQEFKVAASGSANSAISWNTAMTVDNSGNVLVGKTTTGVSGAGTVIRAGGELFVTRAGDVMNLNRLTTDGQIAYFRKDGAVVGSIGTISGNPYIGGTNRGIRFDSDQIIPVDMTASGSNADNSIDIGNSGVRFDDIYATNGTIQTSDFNEKQDIAELTDAEQRVAVAAKGLLRKFRWKDSVAEKGDEARTHFGIIAQDLQAAFAAEGLDAGDYAMFISSTWTDEETNEEKTRMGVRYSELLAFIIAAI